MTSPSVLTLLWPRLRFHCLRLGWPALLGLALAVGAGAVSLFATDAVDARIDKLRQTRSNLRARLASDTRQAEGPGLQLSQLVDHDDIDFVIAGIHEAARQNGVRLEQGEYSLQPEAGTKLSHYRINFPAKGAYLPMRAWLGQIMAARPGLVVEELNLHREDIGNEMIEAQVRLGLLVREQ